MHKKIPNIGIESESKKNVACNIRTPTFRDTSRNIEIYCGVIMTGSVSIPPLETMLYVLLCVH